MRRLALIFALLLLPSVTCAAPWWETAPGGTASSVGANDRLMIEQGGASKITTKATLLQGYLTGNQNITVSGDASGSGATGITLTIGDNRVLERHLKAVNSPTDEYCLTYEATTGDFEWQQCGGITSLNGSNLASQSFAAGANMSIATADGVHTFAVTGVVTSESDPTVAGAISAHLSAADHSDNQTASDVPITDTGAYYTTDTVEAALQQIGPTMTNSRTPTTHGNEAHSATYLTSESDPGVATHESTYSHSLLHSPVTAGTGISVDGQQVSNTDTGSAAVASHLSAFTHGDISHTNRAALDLVSGTNTGDQDLSGYATLPLPAEADPVFTAWDKSTGISITESQISDLGTYLTAETDPSVAGAIGAHTSAVQHGTTAQEKTNITTAVNHAGSAHATVQPGADGKRYIWKNGAYVPFDMAEKVRMELAENPRAVFWVYGPSNTGTCADGDTPNSNDGTLTEYNELVGYATAAGGTDSNVRWLCDEVVTLPNPSFQATSGYVTIYGEAGALTDMTVGGGTFNAVGGYVMAYGGAGEFTRTDIQGGTFDAVSGYVTVAGAAGSMTFKGGTFDAVSGYVTVAGAAGSMTFKGDVMAGASGYVLAYGQAGSLTEQAPPPSGNFSGTIFGTPTDFTITGSNITVSNGNLLVNGVLGDKAEIIVSSFARPFYVEFTTSFPTMSGQSADLAGVEVGLYSGINNYTTTFRETSIYDSDELTWVHVPNCDLIANGVVVASHFTFTRYNATWRIEFLGNGTIAYKRDGSHVTGSPFTNNAVTSGFTTIRLTPALVDGVLNNLNVTVSNFSIGAL